MSVTPSPRGHRDKSSAELVLEAMEHQSDYVAKVVSAEARHTRRSVNLTILTAFFAALAAFALILSLAEVAR